MPDYLKFLNEHKLCAGLSDNQINMLLALANFTTYQENDCLIEEGQPAQDILIILMGQVEVLKKEEESQHSYRVAVLSQGDSVGEISLIENMPRGASIVALEPTIVMSFPLIDIREFVNHDSIEVKLIYYKIVENIARELCLRLRNANELIAKSLYGDEIQKETKAAEGNLFAGLWQF
ncbi:MAG: cyclic nucleotide-binding domain-containing protein [Gammaproteobacteria bacterium]